MATESTDRLQEIFDRQDIHDVGMRYCRGADRVDEELLRSVFHDDAYIEYGNFNGLAQDFVPWVIDNIRTNYTNGYHSIANEYVVVNGDDAQAELYAIIHNTAVNEEGQSIDSTLGGRYLDRYERRQGEWRIARRQLAVEWIETAAPRDTPDEGVNDEDLLSRGKMSREDISYSVLPSESARTLDW